MLTVVETPMFLDKIGSSIQPNERDELISFLAKSPDAGTPIIGTGGIRKLR